MNVETVTEFVNTNKGALVVVTTKDGKTVEGTVFSVNSKGLNVKTIDGKTVSRSLKSLSAVELVPVGDEDGYTTAALAAIFDTNAKALRVVLRRLGLGVGKGRRYALDLTDELRDKITTELAA